jgi:cell division protein FtsQ
VKVKTTTNKKTKINKTTKRPTQKSKKIPKNKSIKARRAFAVMCLVILLLAIGGLILYSDIFNIKKITVINNSKVSTQEIIQNSQLTMETNMFKTLKSTIRKGIKSNPYVENVKIKRKLDGEIILDIEERIPTFMLQYENNYIYINNQGYLLEVSEIPLPLLIIKGYSTENLIPGKRMSTQDLKKLDTIIQIIEEAKNNGIKDIITSIDISNDKNFILEIPSEKKTVQFGNKTNINVKILWIVKLISKEKNIEGEIMLNVPNIKKVYFREKV